MKANSIKFISCCFVLAYVAFRSPLTCRAAESNLRVFILDPVALENTKARLLRGDSALGPALEKLERDAERLLTGGNFSVIDKWSAPPSGDKHDYMSLAPYWWPNSDTANGLPYVRRDGEANPERNRVSDRQSLEDMTASVRTLAFAYFFTARQAYAAKAAKLLRVWFLNDATTMNPHLRFAQAVPGRSSGRAAGIIETHNLPALIDAVALLAGSNEWRDTDQRALQGWFEKYLRWLLESTHGRSEARASNNHGSWYDVQVASFSLFVGKRNLAQGVVREFAAKRIAKQIERDGRQPYELARTQSWNYSLFNLEAMFSAAAIAQKLGVDLWSDQGAEDRSIRRALDWLVPFAVGKRAWSHPRISPLQPEKLAPFLRRAALHYRDPSYEEVIKKISGIKPDQRINLLYPKCLSKATGN